MDGVKTAIIGFIFVCIILPHLIKNRPQYFMAVVVFLVGMLFNLLAFVFTPNAASLTLPGGFVKFCLVVDGVCQIAAVVLLFMAAGGMTIGQLAGEFGKAYEVMRRGEEQKTVIVPLSGQRRYSADDDDDEEDERTRYEINTPPPPAPGPEDVTPPPAPPGAAPGAPPTQQDKPNPGSTIPLE